MNSESVLTELKQGNQRFIEKKTRVRKTEPKELANGQSPHTIVITCADSRVPPELIFDQDLGDLFVIRVAGNTATDEVIGSAEYAAANLGSSVCIVLGHTSCGAVDAAVKVVQDNAQLPSQCLDKVVAPIKPAVTKAIDAKSTDTLDSAINFNVESSLTTLTEKSEIILTKYSNFNIH